MKSLRRDIILTLLLKTSLLVGLWYVCFSGPRMEQLPSGEWFFGHHHPHQNPLSDTQEVHSHDSRR